MENQNEICEQDIKTLFENLFLQSISDKEISKIFQKIPKDNPQFLTF